MKTLCINQQNIKVKLIILILSFTFSNLLIGQSESEVLNNSSIYQTHKDSLSKKIKWTPTIGLTYANHKEKSEHTSESNRKAILGFMAGVGINKPFNEHLSLNSGLFLVQKGSKSSEDGISDGEEFYNYSDELRMLYIDVPLIVRYTLLEPDESGLAFYGGVQPSLLLNAKQKFKDPSGETTDTVTDRFKKFDAAVMLGVGYLFTNGLHLNIAYNHGLVNINKASTPNGNNYFKTYNRVFKFSVCYQLGEK